MDNSAPAAVPLGNASRHLKRRSPNGFGSKLMLVMVGLTVGACILAGGFFLFGPETLARWLAPPPFPGSVLIDEWRGGGPTTVWHRRTYQTTATEAQVLDHMLKFLPEFSHVDYTPAPLGAYRSSKCARSPLARWQAAAINEGHYPWYTADNVPLPCVSVTIYTVSDDPATTEYMIWLDWPAP